MEKIKIFSVAGNTQRLDGGAMFGNVPRALWERWESPDAQGRIELACRSLLIECEGKRLLCEVGIGAFFSPKLADRFGVQTPDRHRLLESLEALGVRDSEIDYVILSHLHFDHAGGLLPAYPESESENAALLFPNARYVVGKEAFERALHPHLRDRASFIPQLTEKLQSSGRLDLIDKDSLPGVLEDRLKFRFTSGHTPGQMHTLFKGETHSVFFAGDLIPGQAWMHLPITMGYDRYPEKLIDEKKALYDDAVPEKWLLFFTHDAKVSACFVDKDAKGRFTPVESIETLTDFVL